MAVSSDRGLCGAIHTSIVKAVKASINEKKDGLETRIVCIGDKAKAILQRTYAESMLFSVNDIGKRNITFLDASEIANEILKSGYEFDSGELLYNKFKWFKVVFFLFKKNNFLIQKLKIRSVISYNTINEPFFSANLITNAKNFGLYDSMDNETLKCFQEFQLASLIFYGLKENSTSEQSARMSAMDNASKNAGKARIVFDHILVILVHKYFWF